MKERILTGWTFKRVLYIVMGGYLIVQSVMDKQWVFILFGAYFAAMGLFAFGCASGNCYGNSCDMKLEHKPPNKIDETGV